MAIAASAHQFARSQGHQAEHRAARQQYAQQSTGQRQHDALREQLAHYAGASRTNGGPYGHFPPSRIVTGQQQVRHVGAGHRQQETYCAQQHPH